MELQEVQKTSLVDKDDSKHSYDKPEEVNYAPLTLNSVAPNACALTYSKSFVTKNEHGKRAIKKLVIVTVIGLFFCAVEVIGGIISGSLAILTDAAHQLSDVAGFVISLFAVIIAQREGSLKFTFGMHRADVLGALASILLIWILIIWLDYEAIVRMINPEPIDAAFMLYTSIFGLAANLTSLLILQFCGNIKNEKGESVSMMGQISSAYKPHGGHDHGPGGTCNHGHKEKKTAINSDLENNATHDHKHEEKPKEKENLNVRAAIIHLIGDVIQSIGVIIAALIIYIKPEWTIADPISTILFSVLVLFTTVPVFKDCVVILLEGSPNDVDMVGLYEDLRKVPCVQEVHDFHVWALSQGKVCATAHIRCSGHDSNICQGEVNKILIEKYRIYHSTIQVEMISDTSKPTCENLFIEDKLKAAKNDHDHHHHHDHGHGHDHHHHH